MSTSGCETFLQSPNSIPDHLESCASCRAKAEDLEVLGDRLGAAVAVEPAGGMSADVMDDLPVAAWEGANHRAWVLVLGAAGVIVLFVAATFSLLGISPVEGFLSAVSQTAVPRKSFLDISQSLVVLVKQAPAGFHLLIGLSFIVVNGVFFYLLRRPPRGYDASSR